MKERATLFGLPKSSEAYELRDFLKRSGFPFQAPLGRTGKVTDIAPIAVFLASDESRWLTGEQLIASGGNR